MPAAEFAAEEEPMKWVEPQSIEVPQELSAAVRGHPLVVQALVRRGLVTPHSALGFLDPGHYVPTSPLDLPDMAEAVQRLQDAIAHGERILVWGDFDVDGLTATALLVEALRGLGAAVDWYIPDRQTESHGLHWESLQPFLGRGVRVLLTCDTGVAAHEEVALARSVGLDVLVTDHHALPPTLPEALAVVNPSRLGPDHSLRHLSGVGVAHKLAEALGMPERGLDLVAMGLVADVVPQQGEVRYLLQRGLAALRRAERLGIQALLEVAEITPAVVDEDQISYALAPRLNALGRLADASAGVRLFLTQDMARARAIAAEMEAWNVRRQFLSRQVTQAARDQVERDPASASQPLLVLSNPKWPGGVLGIAASRLVERYAKPVVLISAPTGERARGSARSVPGVDIHAALSEHSSLLGRFGGHPMAAGFSMASDGIPELRRGLTRTLAQWVGAAPPERELSIEAYFSLPELNLELLDELARLAPFGPGNPALVLATRELRVADSRTIGRTGEHRRLEVQDEEGHARQTVWWQSADLPLPEGLFDLAYVLRANEFRGQRTLQLEWLDARWTEVPSAEVAAQPVMVDVADYRTLAQPLPTLRALWQEGTMQLWADAVAVPVLSARKRHELQRSEELVVWTAPPGPRVWQEALLQVRPQRVYLFAVDPQLDALEAFLLRLAGLVQHALNAYEGRLEWQAVAAAMAHRVDTVQSGLRWLMAQGQVSVVAKASDAVIVSRDGGDRDRDAPQAAMRQLHGMLRETAAYRAYFREADARRLVASNR
jgi:single-stranded-DNA-specific exonuclease